MGGTCQTFMEKTFTKWISNLEICESFRVQKAEIEREGPCLGTRIRSSHQEEGAGPKLPPPTYSAGPAPSQERGRVWCHTSSLVKGPTPYHHPIPTQCKIVCEKQIPDDLGHTCIKFTMVACTTQVAKPIINDLW